MPASLLTHRTPDVAPWDQYRALREQWTHEGPLIKNRMGWLIGSEGLMFTAYGAKAHRSRWAGKALPFVLGALWLLALASSLQH